MLKFNVNEIKDYITTHNNLNTSHVKVQQWEHKKNRYGEDDLNTSHVKVQQKQRY